MAGDDDWRDLRRRELHGDLPTFGDDRPVRATTPGDAPRFGDDRPRAAAPVDDGPAEPVVFRGRSMPPPPATAAHRRWLPYAVGAGVATAALGAAGVAGWLVLDRSERAAPVHPAVAASDAARPSCSAPATLTGLRAIVFARARHIGGPNPAWLETQATRTTLRLDDAQLKAFDPTNAIAVCSGKLVLTLPGEAMRQVPIGGVRPTPDDATLPVPAIDYSVMPTSDGRGLIYTLDGAEPVIRRLVELEPLPTDMPAPAGAPAATAVVPPPAAVAAPAGPETVVATVAPVASKPGVTTPVVPKPSIAKPVRPKPTAKAGAATKRSAAARHAAVEAMIRGNTSLTALDNTARLVAPGQSRAAAREQAGFIARRDECTTSACLARVYRARIDSLARRRASETPALPPTE